MLIGRGGTVVGLTNVDGSISAISSSSLLDNGGTAGDVLSINGGTADFTFPGEIIRQNISHIVNIQNKTGGTVALSGLIEGSAAGGDGISLTNNTGATINFTGGMTLSTGANAAFVATGGGTVSATQNNTSIVNTLTTTTGTALNVANTNIGASGLTFRSITAGTVAGSAGDGIILNTTGTAAGNGGLTVTGNGSASTGGTIQHKTGADGSTAGGIGIYLNSTKNASFNWMQMNDFDNFGIFGTNVSGFIFDHSVLNGISGSIVSAADEAAIRFDGLTGSASISNTNISGGFEYNIKILNSSGTLNRLTMDTTTIGANHDASSGNGGDSVQIATTSSATANVTMTNSTLTSAGANVFNMVPQNQSNMDLVFRSNNVSNNHANQAGASSSLVLASSSTGNVTYDISHNTLTADTTSAIANTSNGIAVAKGIPDTGSGGTMVGTVNANTIGQSGVVGSGSAFAGIFASSLGSGTHTTAITNNIIYHYNEEGILLKANDPLTGGNSVLNATVTSNQTLQPDSLAFAGIWILAGSGSGTETQILNVVLGSQSSPSLQNDFSVGDPANATDVEIQELGNASTLNLTKAGSSSGTVAGVVNDDNIPSAVDSSGDNIVLVTTFPATPPPVAP